MMKNRHNVSIQKTGYLNFGSFFTDSVEDLVSKASQHEGYIAPALPFRTDDLLAGVDESLLLGQDARKLFMVNFAAWTFLNHGAFGAVCAPAYKEAARWREHCERQPLTFLDRELFPQVVRVMLEVASFIHASPQDVVFLPNATTGLNIVIQSCGLGTGDTLYMLDIGYGSVKKMALAAAAASGGCPEGQEKPDGETSTGLRVVMGQVRFPISGPDEIVELVASSMPANTKLAVFDAITSNTALVLPIQRLVELCKSRGIPVLVDAAHALGQLPVNLDQLGADYYVANCHKWMAGPRGSALMWVHPSRKAGIRPLVVSHGSGSGFTSDFIWDGCRDYAPYLGLSSAVRMWTQLGPQRCRDYCHCLLVDAVQLLTSSWQTRTLAPMCMSASMALVALPDGLALAVEAMAYTEASLNPDAGRAPVAASPGTNSTSGLCQASAHEQRGDCQGTSRQGHQDPVGGSEVGAQVEVGGRAAPSAEAGPSAAGSVASSVEKAVAEAWTGNATSAEAKLIQDLLHFQYKIECPIKCIQGVLYVRLSTQIYNDLQDYRRLGDAVADIMSEGGKRQP